MAKLYISGPMSGYTAYNFPAFFQAERDLTAAGFEVLNPASNPELPTWEDYLRLDIAMVCQADGIAVLADWQMSAGAQLEVHVAQALRMPVHSVGHWLAPSRVEAW